MSRDFPVNQFNSLRMQKSERFDFKCPAVDTNQLDAETKPTWLSHYVTINLAEITSSSRGIHINSQRHLVASSAVYRVHLNPGNERVIPPGVTTVLGDQCGLPLSRFSKPGILSPPFICQLCCFLISSMVIGCCMGQSQSRIMQENTFYRVVPQLSAILKFSHDIPPTDIIDWLID